MNNRKSFAETITDALVCVVGGGFFVVTLASCALALLLFWSKIVWVWHLLF